MEDTLQNNLPLTSNTPYDPNVVYESKLLFLSSIERLNISDDPGACEFLIPPELINVNDSETIRLTLIDFYCPYSWFDISDMNNSFTITRISNNTTYPYTITPGSPNICDIVGELSKQNSGIFKFSYSKTTSKVTISTSSTGTFTFSSLNESYQVLGFKNPFFSFTTSITSDAIVKVIRTENLFIRIPAMSNHENIEFRVGTNEYSFSNILAKIPIINTKPFDMIYYQSRTNNYALKYDSTNINLFRIEITDYFERKLPLNLDWNMTIKVEYLKYKEIPLYYEKLNSIDSNLGLILVQNDKLLNK